MNVLEAKYNESFTFPFSIMKDDGSGFAKSLDWTPAIGDVKVVLDNAAATNITTLPTIISGVAAWNISLSALEMRAKEILIVFSSDSLTDTSVLIQTFGNSSARKETPFPELLESTLAEMPVGAPPATATVREALTYLYMALRNKIQVSQTEKTFYNDSDTAIWKKSVSSTDLIFTEGEGSSP